MVKRVVFGAVANEGVASMSDINGREFLILGLLAVFVLGLGLWPAPVVDVMSATVENLVNHIIQTKL
jgi:NADH-quinone oxidoreductase subunit M